MTLVNGQLSFARQPKNLLGEPARSGSPLALPHALPVGTGSCYPVRDRKGKRRLGSRDESAALL